MLVPGVTLELVPKPQNTSMPKVASFKETVSLCKSSSPRVCSCTHLFLLMVHVVDEQDAVTHPIAPSELLQCNSNIHPLVRLPVPPPLQSSGFNPNRLQGKHKTAGIKKLHDAFSFTQILFLSAAG